MKLDLRQISRAKARWQHASGGLHYLLTRIRRELAERWKLAQHRRELSESSKLSEPPNRAQLLLFDFDDSEFPCGDAVQVQRVSIVDWQTTAQPKIAAKAAGNFDGVVMCLQPAWLQLNALFAAMLPRLRPSGALLFCTFGPDTLQQLRWAWQQVDSLPHVHPFFDMHIIGDQLLQCGFTDPIMDVDRVTVEYAQPSMLYADLRSEGFINIMQSRRKTLTGKARARDFHNALTSLRPPGAPLAITYELIYGFATAPRASLPASASQVRVAPPKM